MSPKTKENLVEDAMKLAADKTGSFRRQCRDVQEHGVDEDTWSRTQIVSRTSLNRLAKATIRDLVLNEQNKGKCVLVIVLERGYARAEGSWFTMVMDAEGLVIGLVLYNYPFNELFAPGTRLIIKEPYCKYKLGFPFFRCDSPTDILVLLPAGPKVESEAWRTQYEISLTSDPFPSTSVEWRARGDRLRASNELVLAREAYSLGKRMCEDDDPNLEPILLDLLDVNFSLGYYEWVVEEAKKNLENEERALLILGKAYYELRRYDDALSTFQNLTKKFKCSRAVLRELEQAEDRVKESKGKVNLRQLLKLSEDYPHLEIDCANFNVEAEVTAIEGKGRGIVLKKKVEKDDVLMVARAIVATLDCDEFKNGRRLGLRRDTRKMHKENKLAEDMKANDDERLHRMRVVSKLTELVLKNPKRFGSLVFELYSRKHNGETVQSLCEGNSERICDVDWINDVYSYNGFFLIDGETRLTKGCGIFHFPSFMNHSCAPNVDYAFLNNVMVVWALEDLTDGTELTINYGLPEMKYQERTNYLKGRGFVCTCWKCEKRI